MEKGDGGEKGMIKGEGNMMRKGKRGKHMETLRR